MTIRLLRLNQKHQRLNQRRNNRQLGEPLNELVGFGRLKGVGRYGNGAGELVGGHRFDFEGRSFLGELDLHSFEDPAIDKEMKRNSIIIIGALLLTAATANAGDLFGAALKPSPSVTLFGQRLIWPIPSLCVGAKAGVLPDAGISPEGINLKLPYLALDLPFPSLTLSVGGDKATLKVKPGSVEKTAHKPKKD